MTRRASATIIGCGLLLATGLPMALAQGDPERPDYEVEIVIFAYTSAAAGGEEFWPERLLLPRLDGVLELLPPPRQLSPPGATQPIATEVLSGAAQSRLNATAATQPSLPDLSYGTDYARQFELLDPAKYRLRDAADRIDRSGRYRVLWHSAWRQPGLGEDLALAVHVQAGEPAELRLIDLTRSLDMESLLGHPPLIEPAGPFDETAFLDAVSGIRLPPTVLLPPDPERIKIYPLDGSLRLEMGRYLHLYADLILTQPVGILPRQRRTAYDLGRRGAEALQSFPVRSHRRMRSGELHHIDHPMLGILVLTTRHDTNAQAPVPEPEPEREPEPEAAPEAAPDDGQ